MISTYMQESSWGGKKSLGKGVRLTSKKLTQGFSGMLMNSSQTGGSGQKPKAGTNSWTNPVILVITKLPMARSTVQLVKNGQVKTSVLDSTRKLKSNSDRVGGKNRTMSFSTSGKQPLTVNIAPQQSRKVKVKGILKQN